MRPLVAFLFVTAAFTGCFGWGGDVGAGGGDTEAAPSQPTLPSGLQMEDADIIGYTSSFVAWRWYATVGPGLGGQPEGPATVSTTFEVPPGVGLVIEANLTWQNDDFTDIGVRIEDADGRTVCTGVPPSSFIYPSMAPASACSSSSEPLPSGERWTVSAVTYTARETQTPFTVDLRLEVRPEPDLAEVGDLVPFEAIAEDGVVVRGHVYLPDTEPPFATVVEMSGYWNTYFGDSTGSGGATAEMAVQERGRTTLAGYWGHFMDAGFAVALVNIRGTGISDGCQDFAGDLDVADAGLVIDSLANQPWSNGRVGLVGGSWPGTSVYTGISSATQALKAAVPFSATIDWWHDATHNGAVGNGGLQTATYEVLGTGPVPVPDPIHASCPDLANHFAEDVGFRVNGDRTSWYAERNHRPGLGNTTAAVLGAYGMANAEWVPLRDHAWWDRIPHEQKHLVLGQWRHGTPTRADFLPDAVAWFDHYLRDGLRPPQVGSVEFQDSVGAWHTADRWPPAGTEVHLRLSDGALVSEAGDVASSQVVASSTQRRALPDTCPDTALFVSPPLAEAVVLAGVFQANITVSSTLPDGNFAANLWHVDTPWPCRGAPGTQGITGGSDTAPSPGMERYEVALALSDLYHRGHLDIGSDFPTGTPDVMRMTSESFATFVPAGERLVLAVGGGDPWLLDDPRKPLLTVHTSSDIEGELVLNVVEGNLAFEGEGGAEPLVGGVVG